MSVKRTEVENGSGRNVTYRVSLDAAYESKLDGILRRTDAPITREKIVSLAVRLGLDGIDLALEEKE